MRVLLFLHIVLVILAGTAFTVLTFVRDGDWFVELYKYWSSSGFGQTYESPYSTTVIFTYLAAFSVGLAAYVSVLRSGNRVVGAIGVLASLLGIYCFGNEFLQLGKSQYNSWIAVSPLLMLVLAAFSAVPHGWLRQKWTGFDKNAPITG